MSIFWTERLRKEMVVMFLLKLKVALLFSSIVWSRYELVVTLANGKYPVPFRRWKMRVIFSRFERISQRRRTMNFRGCSV